MPELLLICFLMIPQIVAGILAKSMGRKFWFWFFISFLIPIISLVVLLFLEDKSGNNNSSAGYKLADRLKKEDEA